MDTHSRDSTGESLVTEKYRKITMAALRSSIEKVIANDNTRFVKNLKKKR